MAFTDPLPWDIGYEIYVRDDRGIRQGLISDYFSASLKPIYNDVGAWSLVVDRRGSSVAGLVTPGWGIEVARYGKVILSGPANYRQHQVDSTQTPQINQLAVSGITDEVWLQRRMCSPEPATVGPPYSTSQYDTRSGAASTVLWQYVNVNAGPAAIASRQVPGFAMATDPALGSSVNFSARWDNLLTVCQSLALVGNIGFRVESNGAGQIVFTPYANPDRTQTMKFSVDLGNVAKFALDSTAPKETYEYVLGSGDSTAQQIYEQGDGDAIATWGRFENTANSSGSTTSQQLQQSATDALGQGSEQATLTLTPDEIPGCVYGVDYMLGDIVTMQLEGTAYTPYGSVTGNPNTIQDIVRTADIELSTQGPQTVTIGVGTPSTTQINKTFTLLKQLSKRVNYVERLG